MSTEDRIRKTYDEHAEKYHELRLRPDVMFFNSYIENPAVLSLLEGKINERDVLDMGCGPGVFTKQLHDLGARVKGVDFAPNFIKIAQREHPGLEFYVEDASSTHFEDESFDVVCSNLMLHYFKDLRKIFSEVNRVLRQKGVYVFSTRHPLFGGDVGRIVDSVDKTGVVRMPPYFRLDREFFWQLHDENKEIVFEMPSYRQNFEDVTLALYDSGLVTEKILEPRPVKEAEKVNPLLYEVFSEYPTFMVLQARKS